MTSKKPKTHQKLLKNGLLKEEDLLPLQFEDHNEMLKHYGDESLNRFKSQNLSIWGDLSLVGLAKPRFVLLSRDKEYLMMIFKEKYIRVHNFRTKHAVPGSAISPEDLKLEGIITCAAFCDVNKCLFVGSLNGEIMQINLNHDDIRQGITPVINSTKTAILTLDVSSDGQVLVYSHSDLITTIDLSASRERTYSSKLSYKFESAYFVGENHSLLINMVKKNDRAYEIKTRAADSTPKKKNIQAPNSSQYAKLMQNKKYYVALKNISNNTKTPYTEVQIFAVDERESPIRTLKFELHAPADYDKLQFHLTDDKKYLFCHSAHTTSLYIHDFTNQNTTPQCAKIPLEEYIFACFSNDDSCLALVTEDGRVAVCNLLLEADRILSRHRLNFFDGKKDSLVLSDDGEYVAYFQQNKDVEVLDLRSHRVIFSLQKLENYTEMVSASMEFSNDELIIEYQAIFATDPGNKKKYIITEKLPSYGSDPVGRSINLAGLEAKSIEPVQNEVEDEAESQEIEPGHVIPGLGTFKELDNHMPNAMPHKSEEHKTVYTEVWEDRKSLTSFVEKEDCLVAVKSSSGTYAFTGFKDSTVKVYTFPKLKFVCSWKNRDQSNLVTIKVPKGDKFILTAHENGYVEIRDFNFAPQSSSAEDASKFYSFERYLRLDKISLIDGLTKPQNYHISYEQTILHLKALANNPDSFVGLEYNKESEVPFLRDKYNKTPLHYLLYHKKIDYGDLDALANYVLEYMYQLSEQNYDEYVKVLDSLKKIIPVLILDLAPGVATKYIEMVAPIEKVCLQDKVGYHVFAENRTVYWPENDFNAKEIDTLRDGQEKMEFQKLCLKIDYTPHSEDILNYAIALGELKKEDLFKVPAIAHLVDYIWISTKRWTFLLFIWFSVLMILLSLSVAISERTYGLEITILVFASIGLVIEVMQLAVLRLRYWKTLWNNMDLICLILIYIYIIFKLSDFDDELTENWIAALMIFFGYLRWAAYLRLFRQTRQLIEVIVTITRDMFSFLIIMALITLGFSIIFLKFLREEEDYYLWHLYYSYQLWYGNADGIPGDSASVLVLECAIMFIMPVVLLNLLVTLMGESRETVKEKAILTDSRTRLAMSIEAISLRRGINYILVPLNKTTSSKTSLFVCVPKSKVTESAERAEEEDKIEKLQEQIKEMKKMLEDSKQAAEKDRQIVELKDQVAEMAQALKDSKDEQTMKFRKLEELAVRNQMLQVQARRSEKLEEQIKQHKQIDPQEFEDVVKHQINEMKTHLRQFMIEETSQIKDYVKESVKECVDKIDKALPKTEAEPTTKNELVNGVEEEYERKDSDE